MDLTATSAQVDRADAELDHHDMSPPSVRKASHRVHDGSQATVWDMRIAQPNVGMVPGRVLHSLEHMLSVNLRQRSPAVVNVGLMGCRTGFYIITLGAMTLDEICHLLQDALHAILRATEVALANSRQCGSAEYHTLTGAQEVAQTLLLRRSEWAEPRAPHARAANGGPGHEPAGA